MKKAQMSMWLRGYTEPFLWFGSVAVRVKRFSRLWYLLAFVLEWTERQLIYFHVCITGGTVLKLGTERHHSKLLKGIDTLDDVGCFGLTELGYGTFQTVQ